ncbi:glutathione binding-like protein [Aerosakkonemataceae cyanobacterium BLCC-F50]|uniref:Glutathione binding-like protein n=1 Tax=Floridaenema flaviceps BLCC-F50 TaxID=3153642 RepID=A0ABV4Y3N5_9CYAN
MPSLDSTKYPERPIIPTNPQQSALCFLLEELADESIGLKSRMALFSGLSQNQSFRTSILPTTTPDFLKQLVAAVPSDLLNVLGFGMGLSPEVIKSALDDLKQVLQSLSTLVLDKPYLVGDKPTLADFAVAGLSMYVKFPDGPYLDIPPNLRGKGVPEIADSPAFDAFFNWRDQLYAQYRKPLTTTSSPTSGPTSIQID